MVKAAPSLIMIMESHIVLLQGYIQGTIKTYCSCQSNFRINAFVELLIFSLKVI